MFLCAVFFVVVVVNPVQLWFLVEVVFSSALTSPLSKVTPCHSVICLLGQAALLLCFLPEESFPVFWVGFFFLDFFGGGLLFFSLLLSDLSHIAWMKSGAGSSWETVCLFKYIRGSSLLLTKKWLHGILVAPGIRLPVCSAVVSSSISSGCALW